ncbi:MAG: cytochrome c maturation protein CcmE [Actinomycetia bacterium]|nr:cytochrome c maturation protein CcmE [Actinomycetes bacterium]
MTTPADPLDSRLDDAESADAGELDLTPRTPTVGGGSSRFKARSLIILAALLGALGFVVYRGLGDASLFFRNVDEAVEQKAELGDDRFRIQGIICAPPQAAADGTVTFAIAWGGAHADVSHMGDPPELFEPGQPVVLEGSWAGTVYASDRILVKHSEEYVAENDDRINREADFPPGCSS